MTTTGTLNYTGFVKITKKYKKLHKSDENVADTHTRIMAYVHEADFVKHESLLRLEQATQSLMARRFYNGNRELANAALRLIDCFTFLRSFEFDSIQKKNVEI